MKVFSKIISSVFHPLFTPIIGTVCYFKVTPKYYSLKFLSGNILPIFILTIIVPIIAYLILRNLGIVTSYDLPTIKERKYPFYVNLALLLLIVYRVIPVNYSEELFYFFLGLIAATFSSLLLLFFGFKSSMHLMGMGTLVMLLINLSVHYEINIIMTIAIGVLCTGFVASSRLYLKVHNTSEIIVGFLIGSISQLITIKYWL